MVQDKKIKVENQNGMPSLGNLIGGKIILDPFEEVLEKQVKKFSNTGAHIILHSKHIGADARVMIYKKDGKTLEAIKNQIMLKKLKK